jgi:hypothetical protein
MIRVRFLTGVGIFLFTTSSKSALGPTQSPIQWVPRIKRPKREAELKYTQENVVRLHLNETIILRSLRIRIIHENYQL